MKRLFHNLRIGRTSSGFTMIELLVVIAVIGVLAVAVLSSINPIEQINKGRDTRVRSNAAQLLNAADRFYAIHEIYPWNDLTYGGGNGTDEDTTPDIAFPDGAICTATTTPAGFCQIGGTGFNGGATDDPSVGDAVWLSGLSGTEEVKDSFIDQLENDRATNALYISKALDGDLYICFTPSSKAFQLEALTDCESRDAILPADACPQADYSAGGLDYADELICLP